MPKKNPTERVDSDLNPLQGRIGNSGLGDPARVVRVELAAPDALMNENLGNFYARLEILGEAEWLSAGELAMFQRLRAAEMVDHAARWSPYYRDTLRQVFQPGGGVDWTEWRALPPLARETILTHEIDLHSTRRSPEHGGITYARSRGLTGESLSIPWTDLSIRLQDCIRGRLHRWHDINAANTSLVWQEEGCEHLLAHWSRILRDMGIEGTPVALSPASTSEDALQSMLQLRPQTLEISVERLRGLLRLADSGIGSIPQLDAVICWGAPVDAGLRENCRATFGARIIETYRTTEAGTLAVACPYGSGLHAMADTCLVEIESEDGELCDVHEEGTVTVTPFFNAAMPLIRYSVGDLATRLPPCPCGRSLPLICDIHRAGKSASTDPVSASFASHITDETGGQVYAG